MGTESAVVARDPYQAAEEGVADVALPKQVCRRDVPRREAAAVTVNRVGSDRH